MVEFVSAFLLGLLTPLGAACVLPLYPAFLVYISNSLSKKSNKNYVLISGILASMGVISFMFLLGLVFTFVFQVSLTSIIRVISPIAFILLLFISLLLIFNVDVGSYLPRLNAPRVKNPLLRAFFFGFFFGAIIVPCNPLFIAALFARAITLMGFLENILTFFFFSIGISAPLLLFSIVSLKTSTQIIGITTKYRKYINIASGIVMLVISVYYLLFVFQVLSPVLNWIYRII